MIFVPFSTGSSVFPGVSVITLFSSEFLLITFVNKLAISLLSSTRLSITFKFSFEESELVTVVLFSDLITDELSEVETATESLFLALLPLKDSSILSLVILFVFSTLLTCLVIFDSSLLALSLAITVLLLSLLSSCALATPPKNTNEPMATDTIPKLNFFIPYFTIFLLILFLNIFPPSI